MEAMKRGDAVLDSRDAKRLKADEKRHKEGRRRKKRKVALFLGYVGASYHGMQRNPGVQTIEGLLQDAMYEAGGISPENRGDMFKIYWSRAARTDRGVSAVGQCVSLKMACEVDGKLDESMIDTINKNLPDDVRCYGMIRPTGAFTARTDCHRRLYEYIMPLRSLGGPNALLANENDGKAEENEDSASGYREPRGKELSRHSTLNPGETTPRESDDPRVVRFNKILAQYEGTHSFHNFTNGSVRAGDDQAKRFLLSVKAQKPFRIGSVYYISVHLLGQSFIMHQIRKMIGLALHIHHGYCPPETLQVALSVAVRLPVPTAPSLGLLLNTLYFDLYNEHHKEHLREPVTPDRWKVEMDKFKHERIYPVIARTESIDRTMASWLKKSSACALYDRDNILAQWARVREENPPKQSPAERRRARMSLQYSIFTSIDQTPLQESNIGRFCKSFRQVFKPKSVVSELGSHGTEANSLKSEKLPPISKEGKRQTKEDINNTNLGPDFVASAPQGMFLLGSPTSMQLPSLGFAVTPRVSFIVGREKVNECVTIRYSSAAGDVAVLRSTGIRMACKSIDVERAKSLATAWKALIMLSGLRSSETHGAKVMIDNGDEVVITSITSTICAILACARLNHRRFLKHQLADLAAKTVKAHKSQNSYLAAFSICSQERSFVCFNPLKPANLPTYHPFSSTLRLLFIEDKSNNVVNSSSESNDARLCPLLAYLTEDSNRAKGLLKWMDSTSVSVPSFSSHMKELGAPLSLYSEAVQSGMDLWTLRCALCHFVVVEMLTSVAPRLLTAEDIGAALTRIQEGYCKRDRQSSERDELLQWCLRNGSTGGRRVRSNELMGRGAGVMCAFDEGREPRLCEKARDRFGGCAVEVLGFEVGGFILKVSGEGVSKVAN